VSFLGFRVGMPDHSQPYEITALPRNTIIQQIQTGGGSGVYYEAQTTIEINIFVKRLARDNVDPQLGNMEREVQRIICSYNNNDITGVSDIIYQGQNRIYDANDSYAKSEWRTTVTVIMVKQLQAP